MSSLADYLSEGLHSYEFTNCKSCLDYTTTKYDKLIFRCFECKKNDKKDFNKDLVKRFENTYEFFDDRDINEFIWY